MIQTVLATDMSKHFSDLGVLKSRMSSHEFDPESEKDKESLLNLMFHLSDISNPTKGWELSRKWTDLLYCEFFAQGDLEKQLNFPISQFMDRSTTNIAKASSGFIDIIIKPAYLTAIQVFPKLNFIEGNLDRNKEQWQKLADEYDEKM